MINPDNLSPEFRSFLIFCLEAGSLALLAGIGLFIVYCITGFFW